ncbi:hypothetical protein I302_100691 [Kwoniella bestiolae CBS 10118]|uniref:Uncharacterized protein n=1 Tax=Kwoniella bestiolae CBS 10118 TaxID=1296100 RepID=A0A1B9G5S8_9TREE|nr:hypothetical protein I302_04067 [Kwoniella bestiolae CBS 10118]OCF26384.1 hypothetical protein I302_04067 [Kwoniella bestiolae CBS 10118]
MSAESASKSCTNEGSKKDEDKYAFRRSARAILDSWEGYVPPAQSTTDPKELWSNRSKSCSEKMTKIKHWLIYRNKDPDTLESFQELEQTAKKFYTTEDTPSESATQFRVFNIQAAAIENTYEIPREDSQLWQFSE